jgi:transposase
MRRLPLANSKLQRLTRRRRQLIAEKVRIVNRMQAELHAVCPGILAITRSASSRWFLGLLACRDDLRQLARFRSTTLRAILRIGVKHAAIITAWQRTAYFSEDVEWVGPMIIADARRLLVLLEEIQRLEKQITATAPASQLYQRMTSVPGFGLVSCAELAGEIGDRRFDGEASLALYLGATSLDNTSGQQQGTKTARQVNRRAKAALINAVDHHRRGAVPASRRR